MAFSLGSIYVELVANTAKFLSGMDGASIAARKTGKEIRGGLSEVGTALAALGPVGGQVGAVLQGVGQKANEAFTVAARNGRGLGTLLSGSVLGGVTALGGGLLALAMHAADVGSKIYEASEKTGISASQMSGLMAVSKEVGGNFDGLTTSLARAGANLEKTAEGAGKTNNALFEMMGGAKGAAELGLKPMGDRIQAVLANIFKLSDAGERNLALNQMLGRGWMENVSTLRLVAEQGYGPAIAKAKEFGIYFDSEHAKQAKEFQIAMAQLKGELSSFAIVVGKEILPVIVQMTQGLQGLGAWLDRLKSAKSIFLAMSGPLGPAIAAYVAAKDAAKDSEQAQTDYLTKLDGLTRGAGKAGDEELKLAKGIKHHADLLAELIEREQDQIKELDIHGSKYREIQAEYDRTIREINKLVAAGGSVTESYQAQALALDLYNKKLADYIATSAKIPKLPKWGEEFAAAGGAPEPNLREKNLTSGQWAGMPAAIGQPESKSLTLVLSQIAQLGTSLNSTRAEERALRTETELSDAAFQKLAKIFPGLTEAEVAATAEGRKMIEWLAKFDKLGAGMSFGDALRTQLEEIKIAGDELGTHLASIFTRSISEFNDQLAHLVVTGKANFKQLWQGMEENLVKAGLQKAESGILGAFGVGAGGAKPDGTQGNPLWVRMADKLGLGGVFGKSGTPAEGGAAGVGVLGRLLPTIENAMGGLLSNLGLHTGGLRAGSGETSGAAGETSGMLQDVGKIFGGGKPEGTQDSPLWVRMTRGLPDAGLIPSGGGGGEESGAGSDTSGMLQGVSSLFGGGGEVPEVASAAGRGLGDLASVFSSFFGGFLAEGGDVTPGHAYVVGERHPEFFVPRASGAVVPSLRAQGLRPLSYSPTYYVNTPDADSFKKSQSQLASEGYRHLMALHARNG